MKKITKLIFTIFPIIISFLAAKSADASSKILDRLNDFAVRSMGFTPIASPAAGKQRLAEFIGMIISFILSFLGVIFMILIIYSGILWMTARGNENQIEKSKDILKSSVVGLLIVTAAYAIVKTVSGLFTYLGFSV